MDKRSGSSQEEPALTAVPTAEYWIPKTLEGDGAGIEISSVLDRQLRVWEYIDLSNCEDDGFITRRTRFADGVPGHRF